jgi:biopolymer transport protein ExbD
MSWKVRHEGSPQHIELASAQEVMQGLLDGVWDPADEVRGPEDANWVALENHPQFAEAAADIEPLPKMHEDESKLDMTALIDVCLVLLIFYILTTSYTQLQARIRNPEVASDKEGPPIIDEKQIRDQMIRVTVKLDKQERPIIRIEDKVVEEPMLVAEFKKYAGKGEARKTQVLLVFDGDVRNKTLTAIQDAAAQAGVRQINWGVKDR